MNDERLNGAAQSARDMAFYYLFAAIQAGIKDPKALVAADIAKSINASEEILEYVQLNVKTNGAASENLGYVLDLLKAMDKTKKLDAESLELIISTLQRMYDNLNEPLSVFIYNLMKGDDNTGEETGSTDEREEEES